MFKWFVYIVVSLILIPFFLAAKSPSGSHTILRNKLVIINNDSSLYAVADTTNKAKQNDDKKKIKEIKKAKPVPKPEKIDEGDAQKAKKRERRPPGMERPPEIPRHNGN